MPDLTTNYLGLKLKNPLVVSASPLSKRLDTVQRLENAGAAAIVMYSLFEEQVTFETHQLDHYLEHSANRHAEALSYFPNMTFYNLGAEGYLNHLEKVKKSVNIPVIGSLNGVTSGGWVEYANKIEAAGADALELNLYYLPTDLHMNSQTLEENYVELVYEVRSRIHIPLAVKLSPYFTALPYMARRFSEAGANGLVLFNRFYQPDFDLEDLAVVPNLELSTPYDLRLPLRWIAILYGRVLTDFALTGGVHTAQDIVKGIMAGANVTMVASELLANGVKRVSTLLSNLEQWMVAYEYQSISQMKGSMSQLHCAEPAAFERANYMRALNTFDHQVF
ncbi:MAG: dihydroorotate dehydrogenase-like protein [Chloroflexi bacterium]|nr:dihydroorotate dehydrogenase-like protein [Chloroflexota bacterium]OJV88308.1 MAG: dihydroorotate dehydrogenase [Chloroflexi bacterium 54-19]